MLLRKPLDERGRFFAVLPVASEFIVAKASVRGVDAPVTTHQTIDLGDPCRALHDDLCSLPFPAWNENIARTFSIGMVNAWVGGALESEPMFGVTRFAACQIRLQLEA